MLWFMDFDHLYRYADLLDFDTGEKAEDLVGRYTEITSSLASSLPLGSPSASPMSRTSSRPHGSLADLPTGQQVSVGWLSVSEPS